MASGIDKNTPSQGYDNTYSTTTTPTNTKSQLPSPFDATLASLKQVDTDNNGLTIGDLAKLKFDYEATSAAGNLEDLAFLNMIGDVIGTVHPQSFDLEAAEAFIAQYDTDGSGALEDAELQAAVTAYTSGQAPTETPTGTETPTSETPTGNETPAPQGPAPSVTGETTPTGETPDAEYPFTLADLDTDGSGIVEADEMEAFLNFTEEVATNAGPDGTIDLTGQKNQKPDSSSSNATSPDETADDTAANSSLTGDEFIEMYDIDGQPGLTADEVAEITAANNTIIQTLTQADTDGDGAISAQELQAIANTEIGQQLIAAGYTELTAEDLGLLLQNIQTNNEILAAADANNDGLITAEEVDVLLTDLNSTSTTKTPTGETPTSETPTTKTPTSEKPTSDTPTNDAGSTAELLMGTYDLDEDSQLTTEEIQQGIEVNNSYLEALKSAEKDGKPGLSAEEIKGSEALSALLQEQGGITELSAEDVEALTSIVEEENTLLTSLEEAAGGKPLTLEDLETLFPTETPTKTPTSETPTKTKEQETNAA